MDRTLHYARAKKENKKSAPSSEKKKTIIIQKRVTKRGKNANACYPRECPSERKNFLISYMNTNKKLENIFSRIAN